MKTEANVGSGAGMGVKTAHTPGPWYAEPSNDGTFPIYARTREMGTQLLGEFYDGDMGDALPVTANIALAAAAPELLAALVALVESFEKHRPKQLWDDARAAIAKAALPTRLHPREVG